MTPNSKSSRVGEGHSPGGPPAAAGGGAGAVAAAGPGSDGAGAVQRVAGPCEAVGRPGARGRRGSESHAQKAPPAAPHLPPEPPARAPVPQQHLRGEHQKSTEQRARGGGGDSGARAAGDPPRARGGARLRRPPPRPLPRAAVRGAERGPERRGFALPRSMRILGVGKGAGEANGDRGCGRVLVCSGPAPRRPQQTPACKLQRAWAGSVKGQGIPWTRLNVSTCPGPQN